MSTAAATAAGADADGTARKASIAESAFAKSTIPADIAHSVDQARPRDQQQLEGLASGPLLMQQTLSALDAVPDIPFDELCNDGSKVTARNLLGKLARCFLTPIKEVYLPLMTWGLPTNHLMVSELGRSEAADSLARSTSEWF